MFSSTKPRGDFWPRGEGGGGCSNVTCGHLKFKKIFVLISIWLAKGILQFVQIVVLVKRLRNNEGDAHIFHRNM